MFQKVLEVEVIAYRQEEKNLAIFVLNEKNQNLNSQVEDFLFL